MTKIGTTWPAPPVCWGSVRIGWVTPGSADVGDGRVKAHILAAGLAGAGSKVPRLGLPEGAPARPRWANATRIAAAWGEMWARLGRLLCIYLLYS